MSSVRIRRKYIDNGDDHNESRSSENSDSDDYESMDDESHSDDYDEGNVGEVRHGVNRRAHHNSLERNRRNFLKTCFDRLDRCLPKKNPGEKSSRIEILKKTTKYIRTLKRKQEARREFMQLLHKRIAESKAFNAECKKIMAENDPATAAVLLQQLPKVELPSIPSIIKSDVTFRFDDIDCNSDDAHSTQQEQELDSNSEDTNSTQDMDSNSEDASSAHDTDLNSEDACSSQE